MYLTIGLWDLRWVVPRSETNDGKPAEDEMTPKSMNKVGMPKVDKYNDWLFWKMPLQDLEVEKGELVDASDSPKSTLRELWTSSAPG